MGRFQKIEKFLYKTVVSTHSQNFSILAELESVQKSGSFGGVLGPSRVGASVSPRGRFISSVLKLVCNIEFIINKFSIISISHVQISYNFVYPNKQFRIFKKSIYFFNGYNYL